MVGILYEPSKKIHQKQDNKFSNNSHPYLERNIGKKVENGIIVHFAYNVLQFPGSKSHQTCYQLFLTRHE